MTANQVKELLDELLEQQTEQQGYLLAQYDRATEMLAGTQHVRDLKNYWTGYKTASKHALNILKEEG